jgi:hypothetical protein
MTSKDAWTTRPLKRKYTSNVKTVKFSLKRYMDFSLAHHIQLQKAEGTEYRKQSRPWRVEQ